MSGMEEFLQVYKETWWFWILVVIISIILAMYIMPIFYGLIPILLAYSVYFAYVRGEELRAERERQEARERQADKQQQGQA